jgi:cell division protein FtsW (lipid II flippase)
VLRNLRRQLALGQTWPLFLAIAALLFFGVISIHAFAEVSPLLGPLGKRQLQFLLIAIAVMLLLQRLSIGLLGRLAWAVYVLSLLPVVYTVMDRFVDVPLVWPRNDARNWIDLGFFSFQPSELVKIACVLVLARMLRSGPLGSGLRSMLGPFLAILVPVALILMQPDLGTALTLVPPLLVMLYMAGQRLRDLAMVIVLGVAMMPALWLCGHDPRPTCNGLCPNVPGLRHLPQFVKHYHRQRVYALFYSDATTLREAGYQQQRAMEAIGSGGMSGKGWGNIPVGQGIPEGHTDMVFALIGEQFGAVGALAVLLAYSILYSGGLSIAAAARDPFARLTAVGLTTLLAGQTVLNLAVVLRVFPVTGVTLPLVSYGGSSLLATFIAIGLLTSIAASSGSRART